MCSNDVPATIERVDRADDELFKKVSLHDNPYHVLRHILAGVTVLPYELRPRRHRELSDKTCRLLQSSFIVKSSLLNNKEPGGL